MATAIEEYTKLCKTCGIREDWVQANGGNISVKFSSNMLIKASGCTLFDSPDNHQYTVVRYKRIRSFMRNDPIKFENSKENEVLNKFNLFKNTKPSIETFFHCFTRKYTVHLHPIYILKMMMNKTDEEIRKQFDFYVDVVDYSKPGKDLALKLFPFLNSDGFLPKVMFLRKHGIIIHSDSYDELCLIMDCVLNHNENDFSYNIQQDLYKKYNKYFYVMKTPYKASKYVFSPDYALYKSKVIHFGDDDYIFGDNFTQCKYVESVLKEYSKIDNINENQIFAKSEIDDILNWDAEKHRKEKL